MGKFQRKELCILSSAFSVFSWIHVQGGHIQELVLSGKSPKVGFALYARHIVVSSFTGWLN